MPAGPPKSLVRWFALALVTLLIIAAATSTIVRGPSLAVSALITPLLIILWWAFDPRRD